MRLVGFAERLRARGCGEGEAAWTASREMSPQTLAGRVRWDCLPEPTRVMVVRVLGLWLSRRLTASDAVICGGGGDGDGRAGEPRLEP